MQWTAVSTQVGLHCSPPSFLHPGSAFCQLGLQICRYYCVKKLASVEQVRGAAIDCQLGALPLLLKSDCTCTLN